MNDIPLGLLLGLLAILVSLSAFFSASEKGLMTLNRYRLQYLVNQKHCGATKAQLLLQKPEHVSNLILLSRNFLNILVSSLATFIALRLWGGIGIAVAVCVLTFIIMIFVETAPKILATLKPEGFAFRSAYLLVPLLKLNSPIIWLINFLANTSLKIFGIDPNHGQAKSLCREEIKTLITKENSFMPQRYHQIILNIMDFESATVEDIMTSRNDIVGIDIDASQENIIEQIHQSTHARLPVFKKSIDRVIGFLELRSLLLMVNQADFDKQTILDNLLKPIFIPESTPLHKQMYTFKTNKERIGLVVDEYGDVKGLVTLDDLLQEIAGELLMDDSCIRQHSDGSITVDGGVTIREFNRLTQSSLPTEGPKTINGLIIEYMETIPESGTSINLHGYHLEILEREGNFIKAVRFLSKAA